MGLSLYDDIGGAGPLKELVDRFYDLMDSLPEAAGIRALHPGDLASSRDKLFLFLTGWSGGPQLYVEKHGHPRLRARHMPFPIGNAERDQWLACMRQALLDLEWRPEVRAELMVALEQVADFMRNVDERPKETARRPDPADAEQD